MAILRRWDLQPAFADWRPHDQKVFYCDIAKAARVFGWAPAVTLDEGLDDLLRWVRDTLPAAGNSW